MEISIGRAFVPFALLAAVTPVLAQSQYMGWPIIDGPFPSTGGNGVMIEGYAPEIIGAKCVTDFTARLADGQRFLNRAEFDAVPVAGGILCSHGRWSARNGSASGTTPLQVFIKDGIARRSP